MQKSVFWVGICYLFIFSVLGEVSEQQNDSAIIVRRDSPNTNTTHTKVREDSENDTNFEELPEELTIVDFDEVTSKKLTLVEFFSPSCLHCIDFAPTWERTYKEFEPEMEQLGIQMRQVNCLASGDLCERENVESYPNMRIYAPNINEKTGKSIQGRAKLISTYPRILRSGTNLKKYMKDSAALFASNNVQTTSPSKELDFDQFMRLLGGRIEKAHFVALFPASSSQYRNSDSAELGFKKNCKDCLEYKRTWDKLSNQVLRTVEIGHFNCMSYPKICAKLGLHDMINPSMMSKPKFIIFFPKQVGRVRLDYDGDATLESLKAFALKAEQNSHYRLVNPGTLQGIMEYRTDLPSRPIEQYYPLKNDIAIVYLYEKEKDFEVDRDVLPYLLECVTKSPFNIHLYTANNKNFLTNVEEQNKNLLRYINSGDAHARKEYDRKMQIATTVTELPSLLAIRDNALFTDILQTHRPDNFRNAAVLKDFFGRNQFPLYQELTPELLDIYFDNKEQDVANEKAVVVFLNSTETDFRENSFYNMSLAAHEYYYTRKEYYYNEVVNNRETKKASAEKMKKQNKPSPKILKTMSKAVPHNFHKSQVMFTFIDVATQPRLANFMTREVGQRNPGDAIVISRDSRYAWSSGIHGERLTNDPVILRPLLRYLLDPALIDHRLVNVKVQRTLLHRPYGDRFFFMNSVHDYGVKGYLIVMLILVLALTPVSRLLRKTLRSSARTSVGRGILGNFSKKN